MCHTVRCIINDYSHLHICLCSLTRVLIQILLITFDIFCKTAGSRFKPLKKNQSTSNALPISMSAQSSVNISMLHSVHSNAWTCISVSSSGGFKPYKHCSFMPCCSLRATKRAKSLHSEAVLTSVCCTSNDKKGSYPRLIKWLKWPIAGALILGRIY